MLNFHLNKTFLKESLKQDYQVFVVEKCKKNTTKDNNEKDIMFSWQSLREIDYFLLTVRKFKLINLLKLNWG